MTFDHMEIKCGDHIVTVKCHKEHSILELKNLFTDGEVQVKHTAQSVDDWIKHAVHTAPQKERRPW